MDNKLERDQIEKIQSFLNTLDISEYLKTHNINTELPYYLERQIISPELNIPGERVVELFTKVFVKNDIVNKYESM